MNLFRSQDDLDFMLRLYVSSVSKLMHEKHDGAAVVYAGHVETKDGIRVSMLPILPSKEFHQQRHAKIFLNRETLIALAVQHGIPLSTGKPRVV